MDDSQESFVSSTLIYSGREDQHEDRSMLHNNSPSNSCSASNFSDSGLGSCSSSRSRVPSSSSNSSDSSTRTLRSDHHHCKANCPHLSPGIHFTTRIRPKTNISKTPTKRRKTRTKQAMDRGCKKNKVTFKDDNNNSNRNINSTFEVVKETQASHRRPDPFSELSFSLGSIDLDVSDVDSQHESMDQMSGDVGSVNRAVVKPRVMNGVTRMGLSPLTPSTISPASSPGSSDPSFSDIKTSTPVIGVPVGKPVHLTMLQWVYAKDKVWPSMSAAEVEALSDADWIDYFNQHLDEFPKTHYTFPDCVWYRPITGKKWFIKPNMSNWAGTQPGPHKPLRKFCCYTSKRYIKGVCCDRHGDDESEEDIPSQMGFQSTQNQNYPAVEDMRASSRMSHRMGPSPLDYKMYDSEVSPQSPSSFRSQSRNYKKSNRSYHRQSSHYETPDLSFNSPVVDHKTREAKILYAVIIALAAFFAYLAFQNPECFVK